MKNLKGSAIVIFVITILVLIIIGGVIWYYVDDKAETCIDKKEICTNGSYIKSIELTCGSTGLEKTDNYIPESRCVGNSKYLVTWKEGYEGNSFLIKYKTSKEQIIPCSYVVESGDFEIKDRQATYFLGLTENFLLLDYGTAPPPRGLIVYDLNSHQKVYEDRYYGDFRSIGIQNDTISYWSPTDIEPTDKNCPQLNEWKGKVNAEIEVYVNVDLTTLTKNETKSYRCSAIQ